jgi:glycosyltransferase involved in cell wall biosynthesis
MMWKLRAEVRDTHTLAHAAYDAYLRLYTWIVSYVDDWSIHSADRILVNSYHTQENVLRFYGKKSTVLYLGVDTAKFVQLRGAKENMILSVGALNPLKGHECVIRSLQYLPPPQRPRLVIVADRAETRSERLRLEKLADTLHLDLRILVGVAESELVDLYQRAKLVVCASFLEPFGLVPLEAMACGTPVVAVREGGYRESILHEETGLLVPRNEQAIGEAIGQILSDDTLRERLGARGADFVRNQFGLDTYWANLAQHLSALPPVSS